MAVVGTYDLYLVALSFAVACFASYTALDLATRIRVAEGKTRLAWLGTAAVAMGGGIWSMHFIAMLAFLLPLPVTFDFGITSLSLLVAIAVTGFAFYGMGRKQATAHHLVASGIFMGIGIVSMHYTGMAAMCMPARLSYDTAIVSLSVLIAIGASIAALWLAFRTNALWQHALAAVVMGAAISGMHYTGMAAAAFASDGSSDFTSQTADLAQTNLAVAIAAVTFVILIFALIASLFDRQFAVLAERETMLLREREEMMRRIYRDTPLPLHTLAADGSIEKVSDAWLELTGCTRDEVLGRQLTEFMTEDSRKRYIEIAWPQLLLGNDIREAEYQLVRKSGEIIDVLLSARQELLGGKPERALGGLIDITARKRAEHALLQSQRMEAIGQLTGGVAHDFNNLLMVINGAAQQIQRQSADNRTARPLEMIGTAVKRGQKLTGHLLSFARRQTLQNEAVDLSKKITEVGEMLKRSLRGDIEIAAVVREPGCVARVDNGELELALLNLGVNARDAMPDGGTLTISIHRIALGGQAEFDGLRGDFIAIEVKDTGCGISAVALPRVFDPFFTTKDHGKGTGLGLSQVYGFAKQSGGTVKIESRPGAGTAVAIYLPAVNERVESSPDPSSDLAGRVGKGTVLLVEDNQEVAAATTYLFEQLGYDVEHVAGASDALLKVQDRSRYALVCSDILMPGSMGGIELAAVLHEQCRGMPMLLTTGFSEKAQQAVREGHKILPKPFDLHALAAAIKDLRDETVAA
jgi:PAS domain S-box-containing protein